MNSHFTRFSLFSIVFVIVSILTNACTSSDDNQQKQLRKENLKGEYIYRHHNDSLLSGMKPELVRADPYSWEQQMVGKHPKITKDFFRCKGSSLNPIKFVQKKEESVPYYDCGGAHKHSLPLKDDKEFIYPILIDLLNYIQAETGKRVVITCGHRCPDHHAYVDPAAFNKSVKHMVGAQVAFYVQGLEEQPEAVINTLMAFYKKDSFSKGNADYEEFKREGKESDVTTAPWYNKEIFIKLYNRGEGRDFDQRHPYPYISIQVRFDRDTNEKLNYSWGNAQQYHRW